MFQNCREKKKYLSPYIFKDDLRKQQTLFKDYHQIYTRTDGSKDDTEVGCVGVSDNHCNIRYIADVSSSKAKVVDQTPRLYKSFI